MRDLRGVIEREKAEIGVLLSLREPTGPMRTETAAAGFYTPFGNKKYPRLQILTIAELLDGKTVDMPPFSMNVTLKQAPKAKGKASHLQPEMDFEQEVDDDSPQS